MKKLISGLSLISNLIIICMLMTSCGVMPQLIDVNESTAITIYYTNDVHCALEGGIGFDNIKPLNDDDSILVDCGDFVQGGAIGTISKGQAIIDIMNEAGYDVVTLGNHEFDYGTDRLDELVEMSQFDYVCSNVDGFNRYIIKSVSNIDIAFIGVTTPGDYTHTKELLYDDVQQSITSAQIDGADYIIVLSHLGDSKNYSPYSSVELIENTSGIDVVLDGHAHHEIVSTIVDDKDGNKVILSSTGTKLNAIGELTISADGEVSTSLIYEIEESDSSIKEKIGMIVSRYERQLSEVVATSNVDLSCNDINGNRLVRKQQTDIGEFCASAYLYAAKKNYGIDADIAFINGGGIRGDIHSGDITLGDILEVFPFSDTMCIIETSGKQVLDALGYCEEKVKDGDFGGYLQIAGIPVDKIDPNQMYTVASRNFIIKEAGDGIDQFVNCKVLVDEGMEDTQILIQYINFVTGEE